MPNRQQRPPLGVYSKDFFLIVEANTATICLKRTLTSSGIGSDFMYVLGWREDKTKLMRTWFPLYRLDIETNRRLLHSVGAQDVKSLLWTTIGTRRHK